MFTEESAARFRAKRIIWGNIAYQYDCRAGVLCLRAGEDTSMSVQHAMGEVLA